MEEQKAKGCVSKLIIYLFLLVLIAVSFVYFIWQNHQLEMQIQQLQHKTQEQGSVAALAKTNAEQDVNAEGFELYRALSEAQYLLRQANMDLIINRNIPMAIKALTLADQHLAMLNNPSLLVARQALAKDLEALKTVPDVDTMGIVLKLDALDKQMVKLPVSSLPSKPSKPQSIPVPPSEMPQTFWQKFSAESWKQLQNIIIIKRHEQPIQPVLSEEQQIDLIQKIQLALNQAQWAVLYKQTAIYQAALNRVNDLADLYFVNNPTVASDITKTVKELKVIDLTPKVPDLSSSLQEIQKAMTQVPSRKAGS